MILLESQEGGEVVESNPSFNFDIKKNKRSRFSWRGRSFLEKEISFYW